MAIQKATGIGIVSVSMAWIIALLITATIPGPYHFDFFGVAAERTADGASVTMGGMALGTAFLFLPTVMAIVDYMNKRTAKK